MKAGRLPSIREEPARMPSGPRLGPPDGVGPVSRTSSWKGGFRRVPILMGSPICSANFATRWAGSLGIEEGAAPKSEARPWSPDPDQAP
jgi:hypothetical protein